MSDRSRPARRDCHPFGQKCPIEKNAVSFRTLCSGHFTAEPVGQRLRRGDALGSWRRWGGWREESAVSEPHEGEPQAKPLLEQPAGKSRSCSRSGSPSRSKGELNAGQPATVADPSPKPFCQSGPGLVLIQTHTHRLLQVDRRDVPRQSAFSREGGQAFWGDRVDRFHESRVSASVSSETIESPHSPRRAQPITYLTGMTFIRPNRRVGSWAF